MMMKKQILLLAALLVSGSCLVAQNVARELVIVEIGTGTWCQYCPGSAMGADDLIANGHDVAIVEYHSGDDYQNVYSTSRISYYNITGYPTTYFDGVLSIVGGSTNQSMYPQYLTRVNQRLAVTSPFTIDVEGTHTCFTDFTANITVEKVGTNSSSNLKLHAVLTESHIEESWFGLHEVNFVCREMMPNQSGTALSFSGGSTEEVSLTFDIDPEWVAEECELVVFVQDQVTKEIFQGTKLHLLDFLPEYSYDASVEEIVSPPEFSCSGSVEPTVLIRNLGAEPLTSLELTYYINDGEAQNHSWTGSLDYLESEEVTLSAISFVVEDNNELVVESSLPGGNEDECPANDASSAMIERSMYTPNTVKLILRTDENPEETTWELLDGSGTVLYSGGPYSTSGTMIQETFDLADEACHRFIIYDAGGDGFNTPGFYMLYYGSNTTISQGFAFGAEETVEFNTTDPVGVEETVTGQKEVTVFPNPFSGRTTFTFTMNEPGKASVRIYTVTGEQAAIIEAGELPAGDQVVQYDGSNLQPGMYIYQLQAGDHRHTGKLVVK